MTDITTKKPTPAQRSWLESIERGAVYRCGHSWVNSMRRNDCHTPGRSNYVMTIALRDAGWIDEVKDGAHGPFHDRYPLVLTDAGRAAIGVEIPSTSQERA